MPSIRSGRSQINRPLGGNAGSRFGARERAERDRLSLDTQVNISTEFLKAAKKAQRRRRRSREQGSLIRSLRALGMGKLAGEVEACGRVAVYECEDCSGMAGRRVHTCKLRLCAWCAQQRGESIARRLVPIVTQFKRPVLVTLTIKNGHDLGERNDHLRLAYRKLSRRKSWKAAFRGGFGFQESTYNSSSGWHVHMHLLLDGGMDQRELSREWEEVTGDSYIVDIRRIGGRRGSGVKLEQACYEASKYPCKLGDINGRPDLVGQYLAEFKGRRMMWSFGHCYGLMTAIVSDEAQAIKEADRIEREVADGIERTCPHCGTINALAPVNDFCDLGELVKSVRGWWIRGPAPGAPGGG